MILFTIGFTQKTAERFFEIIKENIIELLIDIRLNNVSQLAGFTKGNDLKYFLAEICQCQYEHCLEFAPTKQILDDYKKKKISWSIYEEQYTSLIRSRGNYKDFLKRYQKFNNVCLLCSEPTSTNCHRGILSRIIVDEFPNILIKHI